jgi:pyruvate dehydrogenase E1 component alpha subunit
MTLDARVLLEMYRRMILIRRFEETVRQLYLRGEMPGLAHLSSGQEAVAVGSCFSLLPTDYIVSTHRGHGHCIAKGADVRRMMAEMLGKETGYCQGKGGTMHIADMEHCNIGATGIVGGGVGLATGAALGLKLQRTDRICLGFFGEGAANQGIVPECFNLAALWRLPVVYVCENNQYGEYTASQNVTAGGRLADRARPFGMPSTSVDGMDVLAVHAAVVDAVRRARDGCGPTLIECETYRFYGHHVGDVGKYRTPEEVDLWRRRDPIERLADHLTKLGIVGAAERMDIDQETTAAIEDAVEFARSSPFPEPSQLDEHVYV